MFKYNTAN